MGSLNKVTLLGRCGGVDQSDKGGVALTIVRLATHQQWKDRTTGESRESTQWHRVKFFGRLGEVAAQFCAPGREVYLEARLHYDTYVDTDKVERHVTDLIGTDLQLLGGASTAPSESTGRHSDERKRSQQGGNGVPPQKPSSRAVPRANEPKRQHDDAFLGATPDRDPFGDDIPT